MCTQALSSHPRMCPAHPSLLPPPHQVMHLNGRGVEQSDSDAELWFAKAAQQGHDGALKAVRWCATLLLTPCLFCAQPPLSPPSDCATGPALIAIDPHSHCNWLHRKAKKANEGIKRGADYDKKTGRP